MPTLWPYERLRPSGLLAASAEDLKSLVALLSGFGLRPTDLDLVIPYAEASALDEAPTREFRGLVFLE